MAGVQFPEWGRVRLGVLGGIGVQASSTRSYYDAWEAVGAGTRESPRQYNRLPGKYYVLGFESPDVGPIFGADAQIAVIRGLTVVPMVRYHRLRDPGPTMTVGTGVQWTF